MKYKSIFVVGLRLLDPTVIIKQVVSPHHHVSHKKPEAERKSDVVIRVSTFTHFFLSY